MKTRQLPMTIKLVIDLVMGLFFIAALGFRSTGGLAHEWIGLVFCALGILHMTINWRWYKNVLNGKYSFRRSLNAILNLSLPIGLLVLCVSGIMNSRHLFSFLNLKGSMEIRQVHSFVAYWGIILLGIHIGIQWIKVLSVLKDKTGTVCKWLRNRILLCSMAILVAIYGIWASFDRAMASKLFLGFSFDFWDSNRPEFLFYTHNIAIMALYISIAHYVLKVFTKKWRA